ncbi:12969_t:CDS:2, partial [Cetraspora pellucida]
VSVGPDTGQSFPQGIYIPTDDKTYLSSYIVGQNYTISQQYLGFNRSQAPGNVGINVGTPFVDASHIYGVTNEQTSLVRDTGNRGKMRLITSDQSEDSKLGYPPKDSNGEYIFGRCNELYAIHGDNWDDETYFQEARRWVIALLQKITYYEYGTPLPVYKGYNPNLKPVIETFFATTSMRYGHSEVSDYYAIVDDKGHFITTLQLNSLQQPHLLQEEVDIYIADQMRYYMYKSELMDVASLDCIRGRDHGIPRYNDARKYYGLTRATDWSDISSDPVVQKRLRDAYGTIDQIESFSGGLAEDHVPGSNL